MKPMNLIDQITVIGEMIKDSSMVFVILLFICSFGMFLFFSKKLFPKHQKTILALVYGFVVVLLLCQYYQPLFQIFDYMVEKIMMFFYFPNLFVYSLLFIIANLLLLKTISTNEYGSAMKCINISCYSGILFLCILFVKEVITSGITIYVDYELYQNVLLVTLLQLTTFIFTLWIVCLGLRKIYLQVMNVALCERVEEVIEVSTEEFVTPLIETNTDLEITSTDYFNVFEASINDARKVFGKQEKQLVLEPIDQKKHMNNFVKDISQIIVDNEESLTIEDYKELKNLLTARM